MSFEFILRIIGMFVLGIAGGFWGFDVSRFTPERMQPAPPCSLVWSARLQG
jgi:hypothetical protein